ncbi:MAG: leucine-rich repeat protein [Parabacteroides gordonii]|uniref:leucine-rich repeat domain-containing protein n=1 Tax=Parabacteroides gordonii TaxID=574930 RepID=UPI003A885A10
MSKGIYHSSMKIRVLFILLLLFVFSSFTEKLMAREAEDNKTVTLTVNYNEERGIIKVNDTYVKNGEQLSIEYLSTVKITVIPNDGYCCSGSSLGITPKRIITHVVVYDASHYNTRPMMFVFENFVEDMIFDFLFFKLYNANIEVGGDEAFNENNQVIIDGKIIRQGKQEVALRYIRGIKIEFVERVGFYLKRVLIDGVDKTSEVSENELELYDPPKNVIVEYAKILSIFMYYNEGGTVKLNNQSIASGNSILVDASTDVRVAIMPDEGYHLKLVMLGITDVTDQVLNNILTISAVSENKEIMVTFEKDTPITHSVKVRYSSGGSVKVNGLSVTSGQSVTASTSTDVKVTITPQTGYHIKQVQLGNEDVTGQLSNNVLTISSISANKDITVIFEKDTPITHSVKVAYSAGGSVKVNGQSVTSGQSATASTSTDVKVTITPQAGYHIKQVQLGDEDVTGQLSNNVLTISSISANKDIRVIFEKDTPIAHVVKVTYSEGGSVQVNGQSVASGNAYMAEVSKDVKVMIKPQSGYRIKQILLDRQDVTKQFNEDNVLTIPSISSNKEIAVIFEKDTYSFRVNYYGYGEGTIYVNGSLVLNGDAMILPAGSKVEIELLLDEGFYITKVKLGSTDITNQIKNNRYTIPALSANSSLSVTFEKIPTYYLDIKMEGGYSSIEVNNEVITSSTQVSGIKSGCSISFQSNKYYDIKKVTLGGLDITDQIQNGSYMIKSMESNLTLKVEYVQKKYTLSLTNNKGIEKIAIYSEEFENVSSIKVASGTSLVRIYANSFYRIKQVLSNGEVVYKDESEENNSVSFVAKFWLNIDEDKELTVILNLLEKRKVSLEQEEPGTLASHLSDEDMKLTTDLFIEGKIDQRDLAVINQMQSLSDLNLGWAMIEQYDGCPANTIPEKAFYHNQNIQTMYLPHSLVAIGKQAFSGSVIFSFMEDSESHKYLTKIGEEAFKDCQYLINGLAFHLTNNLVIEKGAFENCTNLNLVGLPMDLVEVKEATFRNCKNLSITLERDLERIGDYAFENVKEIYNYDWVEDGNFKLSYIGTNALKGCKNGSFYLKNYPYLKELPCFEGCSNMTFITFPPNVKDIPAGTFSGCTSLQYVTMNEKIERIAENTFSDSRMTELYVPVNKTPEVYANSFNDFTYGVTKLFVPADQLPYYRNHPVWGKFINIEPIGTATYRKFGISLTAGGEVKIKGDKGIYIDEDFYYEGTHNNSYLTSSRIELVVTPKEGYSIESVRLNEENITNALDENNTYVIPYLLVDSQLEVKFKKDNTTSSEMINTDKRIYLSGTNQLSLSGFRIGAHVFVYDVNGRMITHQMISDNVEKISLPSRGIYFLLVDKESIKIVF